MYLTDKVSVKYISEDVDPSWRQVLQHNEEMIQGATIKFGGIKYKANNFHFITVLYKYKNTTRPSTAISLVTYSSS